jgi:OOP family OmpA-OmpF porin
MTRIIIAFLVTGQALLAQNLVPNPGFEAFYKCPFSYNGSSKDFYLPGWNSASNGTPDHFHSCSQADSSVPRNWAGESDPHSGNGYVGIYVWGKNGKSYREYIQCKLIEPLIAGKRYQIGFYFKLSSYSKYKADRIGMLLLDSALSLRRDKVFPVQPTLSVIRSPLDKTEWDQARMIYQAHGGETYLVIGNFFDDRSTENIRLEHRRVGNAMLSGIAYFYIDDVSVVPEEFVKPDSLPKPVSPPTELYAMKNIQFEFDSYQLVPFYFPELDQLVGILKNKPHWNVELVGHTDDVGSEEYNVDLSRNRATGVGAYLRAKGIESGRITTTGLGKARPLVNSTDEDSRKINRRVEVQFVER